MKLLKTLRIPAHHVGMVPVVVSDSVQGERVFEPEKERRGVACRVGTCFSYCKRE